MSAPASSRGQSPGDQIAHTAQVLGRATQRIAVFKAIYTGKKAAKTVNEIAISTGLDRIRVLQEGRRLADNDIVTQVGAAGLTAYKKIRFYATNRDRILRLVQDPTAAAAARTKPPLQAPPKRSISIHVPSALVRVRLITIDDVQSFSRVGRLRVEPQSIDPLQEAIFKKGVASILAEQGEFQDWGGEKNDLYTTRLRMNGTRHAAAFAFKGRGTTGLLVPRKMGKNADQIQRLFSSPARVFFIQYHGLIDESVLEQMEKFAIAKSVSVGDTIYFGVMDGNDSYRLTQAYRNHFEA